MHTGQHYDPNMSQVFFDELGLTPPAIHLSVGSGGHGEQTGRMMTQLEPALSKLHPDLVLVYGDTNTTLAAALVAAKLHIPLAHVEAGLRSFNRDMPEEINRVLTDHISTLLFAPTHKAKQNLLHEGLAESSVHVVGDVMFDACRLFGDQSRAVSTILEDLQLQAADYVLVTIHRPQNTDFPDQLLKFVRALGRITRRYMVVWPLHPRTRKALERARLLALIPDGVRLIEPLGYLDMVALEAQARLIITDSGGVQKEAFFHRVPCVTVRTETEWTELLEAGVNTLSSPDEPEIELAVDRMLSNAGDWSAPDYGNGYAAERIVQLLSSAGKTANVH